MCGVVGVINHRLSPLEGRSVLENDAAREVFLALTTLQHRGQDAAGILTYDADGFHHVKNVGLVESVFRREHIQQLTGSIAIGHTRYSTIGRGELSDVQPLVISYPFGLGMAHNGNIVNVAPLRLYLMQESRRHLLTQSDTEIILNLFAEGLASAQAAPTFDDLTRAVQFVHQKTNGSYSIVTLVAGEGLVAFRDLHGIRPLVFGKKTENGRIVSYMVASESVALEFNGYELVRSLEPGEVLFIRQSADGPELFSRVLDNGKEKNSSRPCMFEWVYFASPESEINDMGVYAARIALGKSLAHLVKARLKAKGIQADVIVPVPETSRIAAIALAEDVGVPYRELLIKNRYIKRTFILDSDDKRQKAVDLKLSPVKSEIIGKTIVLVDDSIVRGTTSRKLIELVRRAGAKKVIFVSTCPPIQHPCYYGIDFPNAKELIAYGRSEEEIRIALGADELIYLDEAGLKASLGKNPCTACLDGKYPTDVQGVGAHFGKQRVQDRTHA